MKRLILAAALFLILPTAALAQSAGQFGACNATLRTAGVCKVGHDAWASISATTAQFDDIKAAAAWEGNYQATVPCAQERLVSEGFVREAGVTQGDCLVGEIGTNVANPQSLNSFTYNYAIKKHLVDLIKRHKAHEQAAAQPPIAEPDIGVNNP